MNTLQQTDTGVQDQKDVPIKREDILRLLTVDLFTSGFIGNKELAIILSLLSNKIYKRDGSVDFKARTISVKQMARRSGLAYNTTLKVINELLFVEILAIYNKNEKATNEYGLSFFDVPFAIRDDGFEIMANKEFQRITEIIIRRRMPNKVYISSKMDHETFLNVFMKELNRKFKWLNASINEFSAFNIDGLRVSWNIAVDDEKYRKLIIDIEDHFGQDIMEAFKEKYSMLMDTYYEKNRTDSLERMSQEMYKSPYDILTPMKQKKAEFATNNVLLKSYIHESNPMWWYGVRIIPFVDSPYIGIFNCQGRVRNPIRAEIVEEGEANLSRGNKTNMEAFVVNMIYQGRAKEIDDMEKEKYRVDNLPDIFDNKEDIMVLLMDHRRKYPVITDNHIVEFFGPIARVRVSKYYKSKESFFDDMMNRLNKALSQRIPLRKAGNAVNDEYGIE